MDPIDDVVSLAPAIDRWFEATRVKPTDELVYIDQVNRDAPLVVGYVRVSTQEQVTKGISLDVQRAALRAECDRRGWVLGNVYADEGASAKSIKKRPALGEALEALRDGKCDVLVVSRLDRLSRSVWDFADLLKRATTEGWKINVLDQDIDMTKPYGKAVAQVMMVMAELERELIGLRTKEALAAKKSQGVAIGRPWSVEASVVERIHEARSSGSTLQAIADALNDDQVPTGRGGKQWHPATVRAILQRTRSATSGAQADTAGDSQ
jgi:DNA invertase Pin-like site-specific DNA recombinase